MRILGLKTAQKIIVDLSGRMLDLKGDDAASAALAAGVANPVLDEALAALVMLGFQKAASEKVLRKLFKEQPSIAVEEAVRLALKHL